MTRLSRFADWPLRAKMAALLVGASLLPMALWAYVDLRQDEARLLGNMKDLLGARGDQIARELDGFHRGYQRAAERMARFPDSSAYCAETPERRAARRDALLGLLSTYPASDPGIRGAALLDGAGRVLVATEAPLTGMDLSDRPVVRTALEGRSIVSDPFVSSPKSGSVPTIAYMAPTVGSDGKVSCVAVLWVHARALWSTVRASNALAGPGSFAVLFDREGIRIAHTYSDDIVFHPGGPLEPATLHRLVAERRFGARTRTLLEDVRAFPEQFDRARAASLDAAVFRGFAPVNQTWNYGVARRFDTVPWTVFYMVPEAAFNAELARAVRRRLLLAAGIIAAAGSVGLLFAGSILKPIRSLSRATTAIAGGDLSARVQDRRKDEIGELDASFNAMAERIQAQAAALESSRDELERRVEQRTSELTQTTRELEAEIAERVLVDSALRERDAALHRAHVLTKLGHVITRHDGSFETWSDTLPPLIGFAHADMPQSTRAWLDLVHPQDRAVFRSTSIDAAVTGTRKDVAYRLRRADGTWIHVRQAIEPMSGAPDGEGRTRWFSTLQDVTDQKRVEEALRASEERTRAIVDTALDAIVTMDDAGAITGWSRQAQTTFGWTRDEALGRPLAETIIPPAHREAHRHGVARYLATGQAALLLNKRVELTALHRDGREFPIDLSITQISSGGTVGFSAFVRDITERKLAQSRLQAHLERLGLLDEITRAIGERQDLQSIYQVAIRSLEERLPIDFGCVCRFDALNGTLSVIRVGAHSRALAMDLAMDEQATVAIDQNGLARCVRGELVYEPELQAVPFPFAQRLAGGGLRSLVIAPLESEGRVFGILVTARRMPESFSSADCEFLRQLSAHVALAAQQAELHGALQRAYDDLRQTQQAVMQQERLHALGQMASGIAHDINNAISPVALYTESLLEREPQLSERGRGYLVTIARAIDDVAATVARMREFYRQREPQLLLKTVHLNPLIQQVLDLTQARWSDMSLQSGTVIELKTELEPNLPAMLGIESEVREALTNLIFNAVDAMPDGGVLTLRTRTAGRGDDAPAGGVVVEVADTGVGMDEETRRRCLEPFFTTKGERGTGLGLAMVYGVAQRHGAEVEIDSAPGRGTTVRLSFPIPASGSGADVGAALAPQVPASSLRILVVDDDPLLLKSLCDLLELDGHGVVVANGGQAGIDAFRAAPLSFDAVITDLGMPYVDGRKVAEAVKAGAATMPVILLTGWGQRLAAEGEVPAHVDRVLGKPPKLRELRAALAQLTTRPAGEGATEEMS